MCSTYLAIKAQIKTISSQSHFSQKFYHQENIKRNMNVGIRKGEHIMETYWELCKCEQLLWEIICIVFKKINIELPYEPARQLLSRQPRLSILTLRCFCVCVYGYPINNSKEKVLA